MAGRHFTEGPQSGWTEGAAPIRAACTVFTVRPWAGAAGAERACVAGWGGSRPPRLWGGGAWAKAELMGGDMGPQQLCLPCAGPFGKSVSSCQRLVSGTSCRGRSWGAGATQSRQRRAPEPPVELLVDWARLSGSQPVAQGEVQVEPSRLGRGGGQQEPQLWGSSVSDPRGGCGDSLPTVATRVWA